MANIDKIEINFNFNGPAFNSKDGNYLFGAALLDMLDDMLGQEMSIPEKELRRPVEEPEMSIPEEELRRPVEDEPEMFIPEPELRHPTETDA